MSSAVPITTRLSSVMTPTVKVGPFGSPTGITRDVIQANLPKQLNSLEIWSTSGTNGVINAISFTYFDDRTQICHCPNGPWGNTSIAKLNQNIDLIQGEYMKELSGYTNGLYVTSLTVVTSNATYTFGKLNTAGDKHFSIPVAKGSIVSFFGRSDDYLNVIGAYIAPNMP